MMGRTLTVTKGWATASRPQEIFDIPVASGLGERATFCGEHLPAVAVEAHDIPETGDPDGAAPVFQEQPSVWHRRTDGLEPDRLVAVPALNAFAGCQP